MSDFIPRKDVRLPGAQRKRHLKHTGDETIVQTALANETDANVIMRRFTGTGAMPVMTQEGFYGDFTGIVDYESAQRRIDESRAAFMNLDPRVRERFNNNPAELLSFAQGYSPEALAEELGFVIPRAPGVPEPAPAPVVDSDSAVG